MFLLSYPSATHTHTQINKKETKKGEEEFSWNGWYIGFAATLIIIHIQIRYTFSLIKKKENDITFGKNKMNCWLRQHVSVNHNH